ncbi:MAG: spore coat protein [Thermoactinomyces sp.]
MHPNDSRIENTTMNPQVSPAMNHSAHEVHDVHEVLSCTINCMDQYAMMSQHVKDPELRNILERQYQFMAKEYNTLVECFSTGREPAQPTGKYKMQEGNNVTYGLKPSQPKAPMKSPAELNDQRISGQMLGSMKAAATAKAHAACEVTNPVVRRVLADSIPNCIEMAYELFLWQNKHGYYQVSQLPQAEMQQLTQSYAPAAATAPMPGQTGTLQ